MSPIANRRNSEFDFGLVGDTDNRPAVRHPGAQSLHDGFLKRTKVEFAHSIMTPLLQGPD